jgi:outer membrane protein OmpA-like peptidoglycan-associated protein
VPVSADARGAAEQIPEGIRVTFGDGSTVLNPTTEGALRTLAHTAPPDATFTVSAFAAGSADDPSTPRRLSLSRALAARSVLIAEGIASPRIYVKALGATASVAQGPADRVDVTVAATNPQANSPQ